MKIVLNRDYGGFGHHATEEFYLLASEYENDRTHPNLIALVEDYPADCGDLEIVEIPDNSTDYYIEEHNGAEEIIYVVDGKLYFY